VDAAFDHGFEGSQALQRRVAQALVACDRRALGRRLPVLVEDRRLDRADLAVEAALGPRLLGLTLRVEAELIDLLAGDAATLGDPLRRGELVGQVDIPGRGPQNAAVGAGVGAKADAAHRLDAAGDADVDGARGDEAGHQPVRLLAAAALAVDGHGADVVG
jgi:hypothetical protein